MMRWDRSVARTGSVLALAVVAASCGGGDGRGEEQAVGREPDAAAELVSMIGRVQVGVAVTGDIVPVVRHGEEPAAAWTFDVATGGLEELPAPTEGWITDPSVAASPDWVVVSAATCPGEPVHDDLGLVCPIEAPDALFAYDVAGRRWSSLEIPRRAPAGTGQVVSIAGDTATISHRRSYGDTSVKLSTVALGHDRLELTPRSDVVATQCSTTQAPAITFSDPSFTTAHIEATDAIEARTVALSGPQVPLVNASGATPTPSCLSARNFMLVPGVGEGTTPGFPYAVYRLDEQPTKVASGEGTVSEIVAGPDWFAVVDEQTIVVRDREGRGLREIRREQMAVPSATESGLVLVGSEGDGRTSMQVEAVR